MPGATRVDRLRRCAAAGVPWFLRVEFNRRPQRMTATLLGRDDGGYPVVGRAVGHQRLRSRLPFPIDFARPACCPDLTGRLRRTDGPGRHQILGTRPAADGPAPPPGPQVPDAASNPTNALDNRTRWSRRVAAWDESMTSRTGTWLTGSH